MRVATISAHGSPLAPLGGRETGGMNVYVRELSRHLGRLDIAVDVFTRRKSPHEPVVEVLADRVRVVRLQAGVVGEMDKNAVLACLPEFVCHLRRFRQEEQITYDLVHSHYWLSGWVGTLLQQRWGTPHVAMFHTLGEVKNRARRGEAETALRIETERRVVTSADAIVAASQQERNQLIRLYGASPHRIEVVPCGVDLRLFRPIPKREARARLGLDGQRIVLFVGRIDPIKGLDILLAALARLEDQQDVRLLVIGGDPKRDPEIRRLRRLARQLGIAGQVIFLGSVDQRHLPLYYSAADVYAMPSYYESFGLAALEALACGTPVIASRVGGLTTTVRDGENGFLIPWRCPDPFADRLELLLANDTLRSRLGRAAAATAQAFSWTGVAERIAGLYATLLRTPQAASTAPNP